MKHLFLTVWRERKRIFRFGVIGILSVVLFELIYIALSSWLWTAGSRTLENYVAIALASIFNYLAHRYYTFESHGQTSRQLVRYIVVAVLATVTHTFLFWIGHVVLHVNDRISGLLASAMVSFGTYVTHRLYTFHQPGAPLDRTLSEELDQSVL